MAEISVGQLERALANIARQPTAGTVERVAVREISRLTGASRAILAFFDAGGELESITRYAVGESADDTLVLDPAEDFVRRAYEQDAVALQLPTAVEPRCSLATPCHVGDRAAGALGVVFSNVGFTPSPDTIAATRFVGSVAALLLENQRLSSYIQQSVSAPQDLSDKWLGLVEALQSDLILITDLRGDILDANQVACRILGYTKHEILHQSIADFVPSPSGREDRSLLVGLIEGVLSGQVTSFESAFMTKSGRVFPIEVRIRPVDVEGEQVLIAVASDLTERKRAETQLVQGQRLHALGEMAAGVVHDINNMLTAALGPIEVILASTTDPLTQRLLQPVQQALLDGARTVRRIQAFARQNVSSQFTPIDLVALAHDVVELIQPRWQTQARQQGLAFDVKVRGTSVPPILGSSSELREALINLLNNAIDAMPTGGRITIDVTEVGSTVQMHVTDSGVGMPNDVLQRIFDPFFTTKGVRGSGLGLSVVYGIVARQRGQISVESVLGQGTTFTLTFPIAADETLIAPPEVTPEVRPTPFAPSRDLNVLVIDDQAAVATVLQLMLEMDNHRVRVCANGAEGLAALLEERFDLVCTDINMPEMNGWEIAKAIKAEYPDLPVAFVTGWSESYDEQELQARSVDYVLRKPYQIQDVQELVSVISQTNQSRSTFTLAN